MIDLCVDVSPPFGTYCWSSGVLTTSDLHACSALFCALFPGQGSGFPHRCTILLFSLYRCSTWLGRVTSTVWGMIHTPVLQSLQVNIFCSLFLFLFMILPGMRQNVPISRGECVISYSLCVVSMNAHICIHMSSCMDVWTCVFTFFHAWICEWMCRCASE